MAESRELFELRKQLKTLKELRGGSTELVTIYIPPDYPIAEVSNRLRDEYGQAANIKSKSTRKNVQEALEKIINYLKMFKKPPENGIAVFCGNVSREEGRPDVRLFSIVPPEPINVQFYRCDSTFQLEPLEGLLEAKDSYGLVVLDGRGATLAILRGKQTKIITEITSLAHQKLHGKGGQSARRYQRVIEEEVERYYKRIGEAMDGVFLGVKGLRGVIVGGPGPAKDDFLKLKPFNYQLKVLGVVDTGYTDEYGVRELTEKASEIIAGQEAVKEKALVNAFIKEVVKGGLATYGEKEVREALQARKVETLLVSEGLALKRFRLECSACRKTEEKIALEAPASCSCGGRMNVVEEKDVAEELIGQAEASGAKIEMVSEETVEGAQFLKGFYGIGAFLKYK